MFKLSENILTKEYKQCSFTVMDIIADPNITFDEAGVSNYVHEFNSFVNSDKFNKTNKPILFQKTIEHIKKVGKGKKYDCIIGLSGGADSTYLAYLAKKEGLNPLLVYVDYGWSTEISISNIENTIKFLELDLYTEVIDWEIIKDIQRSFLKASVIDIDVPADHIIYGALFKIAQKMGIKIILSGTNYQTEFILPKAWHYLKTDLVNIKNIHNRFGSKKFASIPTNSIIDQISYWLRGYKVIPLLYYVDYKQKEINDILTKSLNWKSYPQKHFENIFTRFFQGYILLVKFGIDIRKANLSNLICSGQLTKEEALEILSKVQYSKAQQLEDKAYIIKKLNFTELEFEEILNNEPIQHSFYGTDLGLRRKIYNLTTPFLTRKYRDLIKEKVLRIDYLIFTFFSDIIFYQIS